MAKAIVYRRDHINTDEIIPARYLTMDREEDLAKHAMEDLDTGFIAKVRNGDILVADEDFGCGSSREHAVWALRGAGIRAVVARSFARIFFRNCLNNGFIAVECDEAVDKIRDRDELELDLAGGVLRNKNRREEYRFAPLSDFARRLIDAGGLMNYIAEKEPDSGN